MRGCGSANLHVQFPFDTPSFANDVRLFMMVSQSGQSPVRLPKSLSVFNRMTFEQDLLN
jgi:hypothetical protein